MVKFTLEEKQLIGLYETPGRTQLIGELTDSLSYVTYPEEKKLLRTVIDKLKNITDGEYAVTGLFPDLISYEQEA